MWQRLHKLLLAELNAADALDWSKAVLDSSHVRAMKGARPLDQDTRTAVCPDRSIRAGGAWRVLARVLVSVLSIRPPVIAPSG
jgi:hypothetical protein